MQIRINPEIAELYIEWIHLQREPDGSVLHILPENSGAVQIQIEKSICGLPFYEEFEGSPYALVSDTKIPPTRVPGGEFRFTAIGLAANQEIAFSVYPRY